MTKLITVVDNFCPEIDAARVSAFESGFGTWAPNKGEVGSSVYEGMSFWGKHSFMLRALAGATGAYPFPNNMFFRITNEATERAYIHSDRMHGTQTCVAYVSKHDEPSGTAFFRHKPTGLTEMPTFEEMKEKGIFDILKADMVNRDPDKWEQLDFVRGIYNRAVIFHAPLFHSRFPDHGIGKTDEEGRMIWACHFNTLNSTGGFSS